MGRKKKTPILGLNPLLKEAPIPNKWNWGAQFSSWGKKLRKGV